MYQSGEGAMAGDFYDLYPTGSSRVAAVIGDVAGHGIEPSITAFQVKYLLRVFLRQYRDPAQAFEELNKLMSAGSRPEDLVSMCAVVFDAEASTLRIASAGHPAAWLWHDGEVQPLRATGPLLTLDPDGDYYSREVPLEPGDLLLLYTDGLAEARAGGQLFGEERVAGILRRDPGADVDALCKTLLEAARDFATEPLADDVAILAIRQDMTEDIRDAAGERALQGNLEANAAKLAAAGEAVRTGAAGACCSTRTASSRTRSWPTHRALRTSRPTVS